MKTLIVVGVGFKKKSYKNVDILSISEVYRISPGSYSTIIFTQGWSIGVFVGDLILACSAIEKAQTVDADVVYL